MKIPSNTQRLYTDLGWLWPLWGDHAGEYARYCEHVAGLIGRHARRPVRTLLDISCGGGKNAYNLKRRYQVTGLDMSPAMLDLAAALNPDCEFIEGDMRDFSLGRKFDAILMDDGISHMATRSDLSAAVATACRHLEAGGVMVLTPDATAETFRHNQTTCTPTSGRTQAGDVDVVFVEHVYDADPHDEQYEATIVYLIREKGSLRIEADRFTLGLFACETWTQVLSATGCAVHCDRFAEGATDYISFACTRPV
jgi:ubiquinone/menaquinone biosynthesis C-methylase UbiE